MKKTTNLYVIISTLAVIVTGTGCKQENPFGNTPCATLHQGYIKVTNNYLETVRVYIDKPTIYSYNYDLLVPANEVQIVTASTGVHSYTIANENGIVLDQAQTIINSDCDTAHLSKTGNGSSGSGGGGGGTNNSCALGNWGTIKIQNTYGNIIRVYIDASAIYSYNYNLLVPAAQTRYIYNLSIGPHKYTIADENGIILDQAQVQINAACDSSLISRNVPVYSSTVNANGCVSGNWGVIKVQNIYSENIRVYINKPNIYSYNYDMLVPQGQSRFYFSAYQGKHDFSILDENGITLDKAQVYVNDACDTTVVGPFLPIQPASTINGCIGAGWGILKVVNTKYEQVRVYIGSGAVYSYNFDMMVPPNSTRFFYYVSTGGTSYTIKDESFTTIDQAQFNLLQDCDMAVITVN